MLGLKRGSVMLFDHEKQWETQAENTIEVLHEILKNDAVDIQHIGSTSIKTIKAKPIIDIVVGARDFGDIMKHENELERNGFFYLPDCDMDGKQKLFACGSYYDGTGELQTHFVHVVIFGSMEWINYINFRDYLNNNPDIAKEYENLKVSLSKKFSQEKSRDEYLKGKHDFIVYQLRKALVKSYLGKTVEIEIDRPLGYIHKKSTYSLTYPINYGFIPHVIGGDGEELDVYLLGVDKPVKKYTVKIIAIIHRRNDVEDKLVGAPAFMNFTKEEIKKAVNFQEQYYDTEIETQSQL